MANKKTTVLFDYEVKNQEAIQGNKAIEKSLKGVESQASKTRLQFNSAEEAAAALGIAVERFQDKAAAPKTGLLSHSDEAAAIGFQRELAKIQAQEASITAEKEKQVQTTGELVRRYQEVAQQARQTRLTEVLNSEPTDASLGLGGGSGRTLGQRVTKTGRELFMLPDVGPSTDISRGLILGGAVIDRFNLSVGQIASKAAVAAPLLVAVALAVEGFNHQLTSARQILAAAFAAQRNYYDALANMTTEQVQAQIAQLRAARPLLEQQVQETRNSITSGFGEAALTDPFGIGRFQRGLAKLIAPDTFKNLEEQQKALEENIQTETRLTQGLENNSFAVNDARSALEEHTEAMRRNREEFEANRKVAIDQQADTFVRLAGIRRNGTSEQIQAELTANSDRIAILRNFLIPSITDLGLSVEETAERTKPYRDELNQLLLTNELLLQQVKPIVEAREREAEAVERQLSAIETGIGRQTALSEAIRTATLESTAERLHSIQEEQAAIRAYLPQLEALAPTSAAASEQLEAARSRLATLNTDYFQFITRVLPAAQARALAQLEIDVQRSREQSNLKLIEIETERGEKESEAKTKRDDDYLAAEEKRNKALDKLAEDQAQRRAKIERKSNAAIANAIFARDALAAYLAMQQRKEDLEDLKVEGKARKDELEEQFRDQRALADRNYDEALRRAREAAQKAIRLEQDRLKREIDERTAAYNAQLAALNSFNVQGVQAVNNFVNNALAGLRSLADRVVSMFSRGSGSSSGSSGSSSSSGGGSLPTSSFGVPPRNPYIGQPWVDAFGQQRVWNGHGWQLATFVRQFAQGGIAHGLAMVNDGGGVESGYNYRTRQLTTFTQPTRVYSAEETQRIFSGGSARHIQFVINLDGKTIRAASRAQAIKVVDEYLEDEGID